MHPVIVYTIACTWPYCAITLPVASDSWPTGVFEKVDVELWWIGRYPDGGQGRRNVAIDARTCCCRPDYVSLSY